MRNSLERANGDIATLGFHYNQTGDVTVDTYFGLLDSTGKILSQKSLGYPNCNDFLVSMIPKGTEGYFCVGYTDYQNGEFYTYSKKATFIDSAGNQVWDKKYGVMLPMMGASDYFQGVRKSLDGFPIAYGALAPHPRSSNYRYPYLVKFDWSGNIIWDNHITFPDTNLIGEITTLQQLEDSTFIVGGIYRDATVYNQGFIARLTSTGDTIWTKRFYPDAMETLIASIIVKPDISGFVTYGSGLNYANGRYDLWMQWITPEGEFDSCYSVGTEPPVNPGSTIDFSVYPNPFESNFQLTVHGLPPGEAASFSLTDLHGREVLFLEMPSANSEVEINSDPAWPAGVYFATLSLKSGEKKTIKVILLQ